MRTFEAEMNVFYIIRLLWVCGEIECYNLKVMCLGVKLTHNRWRGSFFTPDLTTFKMT